MFIAHIAVLLSIPVLLQSRYVEILPEFAAFFSVLSIGNQSERLLSHLAELIRTTLTWLVLGVCSFIIYKSPDLESWLAIPALAGFWLGRRNIFVIVKMFGERRFLSTFLMLVLLTHFATRLRHAGIDALSFIELPTTNTTPKYGGEQLRYGWPILGGFFGVLIAHDVALGIRVSIRSIIGLVKRRAEL